MKGLRKILGQVYKCLWLLRFILPIDGKKIVVVSYYGRGYSDNPKYIAEELHKRRPDLKIYWAVKNEEYAKSMPPYVKIVRYRSLGYVFHMVTAKLWIDNSRKQHYEIRRRGQLYVQTWHAGSACLKKVERHAEEKLSAAYVRNAKRDAAQTDLMVSGSKFTDNCYRDGFWYADGQILSVGSPRNDIFFGDSSAAIQKVRKGLGVDDKTKMVLYAPTFRMNHSLDTYFIDFQRIVNSFESKFGGKWKVALRLHPNVAKYSSKLGLEQLDCVIDATHYDDMQELLVASDALITDYSSSVFDYILTRRPTFIVASDYADYVNERGLYFDLKKLPFIYSESEAELIKSIKNFETSSYKRDCELFMKKHDFYDRGEASVTTAKWILDRLRVVR